MKKSIEEKILVDEVSRLITLLEKSRVNSQQTQVEFFANQLADTLLQLTLATRDKNCNYILP